MNRTALVALSGLFALSACGAGGSLANLPQNGSRMASSAALTAYRLPVSTDAAIQAAQRRSQGSYGGVPTISVGALLTDAPNFGPGAQVNLAVLAVNAMANGTAYPIATYASPVVVNALNYKTSALSLGTSALPAIAYDGVAYVIDVAHSSVVAGGVTYPMVFGSFANRSFSPSASSTASVFFPAPADGTKGAPVQFLMDFNVAQWVKLRNGIAEVGPRGKATTADRAAVIDGTVVNAAGTPVAGASVVAYDASGNRARATVTDASGNFELHAIDGGTYTISIYNLYAPDDADDVMTATGNDPGDSLAGPTVTVPAGYRLNLGALKD